MGRQWGPSVRAAAQAGCVVSASRAEQPEAGFWSCSGVILTRSPVLVLCHGGIFTPFLRGGSGALTSADATFLPADSCGDDLRLHVQPPWVASAVLVEFGSVWGSGVAMAPRLVVTCRHVAPREAAKVLVHSATPNVGPSLILDTQNRAPSTSEIRSLVAIACRSVAIWGRVVFATQETSPYDIAVLSLEEDLDGVPMPVPAEHFQEGTAVSVVGFGVFGQACGPSVTSGILSAVVQVDDTPVMLQTTCAVHGGSSGGPLFSSPSGDLLGIVASNTRDNNTGATYPHLNFSIPITVLQPALQQYRQTGDLGGLRELDHATKPVRVVWRLQCPLPMTLRSKL
ncbi:Peroxisomal leader peptide-processing protease [Heterocephalus glaber]|uniref:Peroxisomal leader peptide-processing protease n=1 Tax=Heterocephalus glaber TaxID=10181 RepID=G5B192_HETGA|nr:Peroxisomal leader peptide-processing protease [Heterocephalus glaber]